jgi:hypothetical protein
MRFTLTGGCSADAAAGIVEPEPSVTVSGLCPLLYSSGVDILSADIHNWITVRKGQKIMLNAAKIREAARLLDEEAQRLSEHRLHLKEAGLSEVEIQRVMDPLESFHLQKKEEL